MNQKSAGSSKQKLSKKQKFKQVVDNETPNFSSSSKQRKLSYWLSPTANSPTKKVINSKEELINSSDNSSISTINETSQIAKTLVSANYSSPIKSSTIRSSSSPPESLKPNTESESNPNPSLKSTSVPKVPVIRPNFSKANFPRVPGKRETLLKTELNDISCYVHTDLSKLSDFELRDKINNVFQPDANYKFPVTQFGRKSEKRSFKFAWLKEFPWLRYSPKQDGAYCIACVFFNNKVKTSNTKDSNLVTTPFRHWPNAKNLFKNHAAASCKGGLHFQTDFLMLNLLSQAKKSV